jgi:pimeloyl-ACP methyl ester carboxylesterase
MTRTPHHRENFTSADGLTLAADVVGEGARPVLLLHGGGQTRHAWDRAAIALARAGFTAVSLDQRGHGESAWSPAGAYAFADFAADAAAVAATLAARSGAKPALVGASLGGIAGLHADGTATAAGMASPFSALVLVDVTPRMDPSGVDKIQSFMRARAAEGFGSIDEAAEAVAAYLPHRPRPATTEGLRKNLRLSPDGRWRWHWDPRFLDGPRPVGTDAAAVQGHLLAAATRLAIPTLLVRGGSSELVRAEDAQEFLALAPHARFADVAEARHMVAGDRNDAFVAAVLDFLAPGAGA